MVTKSGPAETKRGDGRHGRSPLFLRGVIAGALLLSLGGCSRQSAIADLAVAESGTTSKAKEETRAIPSHVIDVLVDLEIKRRSLSTLKGFQDSSPWGREWRATSEPNGGGETVTVVGPGGELRLEVFRGNLYLVEFKYRLGANGEPTELATQMGRQVIRAANISHIGIGDEVESFKRIAALGAVLDRARIAADPERHGPSYWFLLDGWPSVRASADGTRGVMQFAHDDFSRPDFPRGDE